MGDHDCVCFCAAKFGLSSVFADMRVVAVFRPWISEVCVSVTPSHFDDLANCEHLCKIFWLDSRLGHVAHVAASSQDGSGVGLR